MTRREWMERVASVRGVDVVDGGEASLSRRAMAAAEFVRYHDFRGNPDGYFDELLNGLEQPAGEDGLMEPSQALLRTFIHNLHGILERFNRRWDALPGWYIDTVGGVGDLAPHPSSMWVAVDKSTQNPVSIGPETRFMLQPSGAVFCLAEEVALENPMVDRVVFVSAPDESLGFIVSSPVLLLREGRRAVRLRLGSEFGDAEDHGRIADIFHVEISTARGWRAVGRAHASCDADGLVVRFVLPEEFPATVGCTWDVHEIETDFPALRIRPSVEAFPWLKNFVVEHIVVEADVRGLTSLTVYNDLGRIDNSKPFAPFGTNTERGAWFVLGSYEMASKHTAGVDIRIHWGQLPETSLREHYCAYGGEINNHSFILDTQILRDYRWHGVSGSEPWLLFNSPSEDAPSAPETILHDIPVEKMGRESVAEEDYDYTIRSKTGFVRFSLTGPEMGFGEQRFRTLFSRQLMKKKGAAQTLNPPIAPIVERITADYRASDRIDLREGNAGFWHIHSLGIRRVDGASPLIASLEGEANLFFGLSGVQGGEYLRLWFDFAEGETEMAVCPVVKWFWGDGYDWRELPDDVILCDQTDNLSRPGMIGLDIPEKVAGSNILWFRVAILSNLDRVPVLRRIVPNAVRLVMKGGGDVCAGEIVLEKSVAGVSGVNLLCAATEGRRGETSVEKLIRVSEYTTHRGRAVTPRDYERLVLQEFPEIDYVKCLPSHGGVVRIVAIPSGCTGGCPRMTTKQILRIEKFLAARASPAVRRIEVVNPRYEEVLVRGMGEFRAGYSTGHCRTRLKELCDRLIAPWQQTHQTPVPETAIHYDDIAAAIRAQPYVASLERMSIIRLARHGRTRYAIEEFSQQGDVLSPSEPHTVFVPAGEHLFPPTGQSSFGIGEMAVENHLIIDN